MGCHPFRFYLCRLQGKRSAIRVATGPQVKKKRLGSVNRRPTTPWVLYFSVPIDCVHREPAMLDTINRLESNVRGYVRTFPTVFDTACNALLRGSDGREYIDFFAGAGTLNYGHNNSHANDALLKYIQSNGIQHGLDTATTAKIKFLDSLEQCILKPREMDFRVQFTGPTGTNAVEAAVKLARIVKQRSHIVAFTNGYHGHSLGSLALTGNEYYHSEYFGSRNNVTHLPFDGYLPNVDSASLLEKMLEDPSSGLPTPAAVIVETIQCEGGVNVASSSWLRRVDRACKKHDVLLIVDDIQVGNGRTGDFFSFEASGITPDVICLSKSIGGGLPLALVLIRQGIDAWKPGQHTGTFRGNNLAFVSGQAMLETYWRDDNLSQRVKRQGELLQERLNRLAEPRKFSVRGRGMVWGLDVGDGDVADKIIQACFRDGLVIETAGATGQVVKLLCPLTIEDELFERGLSILESAVSEICPIALCVPGLSDLGAASMTTIL